MPTPLQSVPEGRPRLLVVDDDALIADTLSFALGAEFEVLACESRLHAIDLLRQQSHPPVVAGVIDLPTCRCASIRTVYRSPIHHL